MACGVCVCICVCLSVCGMYLFLNVCVCVCLCVRACCGACVCGEDEGHAVLWVASAFEKVDTLASLWFIELSLNH